MEAGVCSTRNGGHGKTSVPKSPTVSRSVSLVNMLIHIYWYGKRST